MQRSLFFCRWFQTNLILLEILLNLSHQPIKFLPLFFPTEIGVQRKNLIHIGLSSLDDLLALLCSTFKQSTVSKMVTSTEKNITIFGILARNTT